MAADQSAQAEWIERVLGIDITAPPGPLDMVQTFDLGTAAAADGVQADPRAIWRDAKDMVDIQINVLAGKLRATGDPDLVRIADLGLFALPAEAPTSPSTRPSSSSALHRGNAGPRRGRRSARRPRATGRNLPATRGSRSSTRIRSVSASRCGRALGAALDRIEQALP